jgi:hypothetical protein
MPKCKITITGDLEFDAGTFAEDADAQTIASALAEELKESLTGAGFTIPAYTTIQVEVDEDSLERAKEEESEEANDEDED